MRTKFHRDGDQNPETTTGNTIKPQRQCGCKDISTEMKHNEKHKTMSTDQLRTPTSRDRRVTNIENFFMVLQRKNVENDNPKRLNPSCRNQQRDQQIAAQTYLTTSTQNRSPFIQILHNPTRIHKKTSVLARRNKQMPPRRKLMCFKRGVVGGGAQGAERPTKLDNIVLP